MSGGLLVDNLSGLAPDEGFQTLSDVQFIPIALLAVALLWFLFRTLVQKRPKLPYPPSPPTIPFFGNVLDFPDVRKGGHIDSKFLEYSKKYGLICSATMPILGRFIICADPDLIKYITISRNFHKSFTYKLFTPVVGSRSIVILEGKEWVSVRRAFNPGFGPAFLKNVTSTMAQKLESFMECIEEDIDAGVATNMLERSMCFTSAVIASVAFGEEWGQKEPHPASTYFKVLSHELSGRVTDPMLLVFGFRSMLRVRKYEALLDQEMKGILERRLKSNASVEESKDICSIAIRQFQQPDGSLTEDDKICIVHQLRTFYFAGHDTTAICLSWTIWLLSQHVEVLTKLREELKKKQVWTYPNMVPTYDELQACTYLEAVIKESLRLHPPATVARYTPDINESFKGYTIGGAVLLLSPYVTHRHPQLWKRPNDFCPERFLDGSEDNLDGKFIPFMRGPRNCIGKYFAYAELKLSVSALAMRYDFECVDPKDGPRTQVTNVPRNGAKVKLSRRAPVTPCVVY